MYGQYLRCMDTLMYGWTDVWFIHTSKVLSIHQNYNVWFILGCMDSSHTSEDGPYIRAPMYVCRGTLRWAPMWYFSGCRCANVANVWLHLYSPIFQRYQREGVWTNLNKTYKQYLSSWKTSLSLSLSNWKNIYIQDLHQNDSFLDFHRKQFLVFFKQFTVDEC